MNTYFLTYKTMGNISKTLTAVALTATLATAPANADSLDSKQKVEQITCSTKLACEKLSLSIQAQIDELEKSDDPDYDKLDELEKQLIAIENDKQIKQKNLIASKNKEIAIENQKQEKQKITIAKENEKQKAYSEVSDKLASIEGSLL